MNVPVSIEDQLMQEAQMVAQERGVSVDVLLEEGLRRVVRESQPASFDARGLSDSFSGDGWRAIQDCIGQKD